MAALILQCLIVAAAKAEGIPVERISYLTVGIVAPLLGPLLVFLWLGRELTLQDMAAMVFRALLYCCIDQNPGRTRAVSVQGLAPKDGVLREPFRAQAAFRSLSPAD